jgi:hypothetical protein
MGRMRPVLVKGVIGHSNRHITAMTKKRVRFLENEVSVYVPTYSREEYDRKCCKATLTVIANLKKRKIDEEEQQQKRMKVPEGSWADAFLSMGSSDFDIWAS